ncbi:hypothetical protein HK405_001085, partial [Cladochytrium tenue]
ETYARSIFFNLQEGMNEENIRETFGKPIVFVEFDSPAAAQSAIGKPFNINDVQVVPDFRKPKAAFVRYDNRNNGNGQPGRGRQGGEGGSWANKNNRRPYFNQNNGSNDPENGQDGRKAADRAATPQKPAAAQ